MTIFKNPIFKKSLEFANSYNLDQDDDGNDNPKAPQGDSDNEEGASDDEVPKRKSVFFEDDIRVSREEVQLKPLEEEKQSGSSEIMQKGLPYAKTSRNFAERQFIRRASQESLAKVLKRSNSILQLDSDSLELDSGSGGIKIKKSRTNFLLNAPLFDEIIDPDAGNKKSTAFAFKRLKASFPFEIYCMEDFLKHSLMGTNDGLYYFEEDSGKQFCLVPKKEFSQIKIIEELGIILVLCGKKKPEIRMYSFPEVAQAVETQTLPNEFSVLKMKATLGCREFELVYTDVSWYLVVTMKHKVGLYLWSNYPHYRFMLVKTFPFKEKIYAASLLLENNNISKICLRHSNKVSILDISTNKITPMKLSLPSKSLPLVIETMGDVIFLGFSDFGFFVNRKSDNIGSEIFRWDPSLDATSVVITEEHVIVFGQKILNVYSRTTSELLYSHCEKEFKKISFLALQDNAVVFSAKLTNNLSFVCTLSGIEMPNKQIRN